MFGMGATHPLSSFCGYPPTNFTNCEDRVKWVLDTLSTGELAMVYQQLYRAGVRYDSCQSKIDTLRKEMDKKP